MEWLDRDTIATPHFILCGTEQAYLDVVKHLNISYPDSWISVNGNATCHTFTETDKITCVVCIDLPAASAREDQISVIGLLVHEAVHIWQKLCESIGEHSPSTEFEAYSIQCISQQLLWSYKKQREAL